MMCLTRPGGPPKRRWKTRAGAKEALRQQARSQHIDTTGIQPYRCDLCGYFHLGHYPNDPKARAGLRERHRTSPNQERPTP